MTLRLSHIQPKNQKNTPSFPTMSVTQRSDEELDREWKPSGRRPQSTMARHFSVTLDDLFKMDNSIADLDAAVDQKYTPPSLLP